MLWCCCDSGDCCANRYGYCDDGSTGGGPLDVLYLTATLAKEFQTFNLADAGSFITHTGTMRRVSTTWYPQCSQSYHPAGSSTACLWLSDETFTVRSGDWLVGRCPGATLGALCMDPTAYAVRLFFLSGSNPITDFTNDDGCFYSGGGYGIPGTCYAGYLRPQCDVTNCREIFPVGSFPDIGKNMINQGRLVFVSCNPVYAVAAEPCQAWTCGPAPLISRRDYVSYVLSE